MCVVLLEQPTATGVVRKVSVAALTKKFETVFSEPDPPVVVQSTKPESFPGAIALINSFCMFFYLLFSFLITASLLLYI